MSATQTDTHPRDLHRIGAQLYNKPWAITDDYMARVCDIFEHACKNGSGSVHPDFKPEGAGTAFPGETQEKERQRRITMRGGVAFIPVMGVLTTRASWFDNISGMTSYERLSRMIDDAMSVEPAAIVLEIDSPGGNCLGLEELARKIHEIATGTTVPVIAVVNPFCASAAYYLASQANTIYINESGMIGNIGTLCRLGWMPLELHTVKSAELKTVSQGSMSLAQLEDIAAAVRTFFEQFKAAISRGRPALDVDAVATGEVWIGQEAIDAGVADEIGDVDTVLEVYEDEEFDDERAIASIYEPDTVMV